MPSVIDPASGVIVTANNRVAADEDQTISARIVTRRTGRSVSCSVLRRLRLSHPAMPNAIHADVLSPHVKLLHSWLARIAPLPDKAAEALRNELLAWDGQMQADTSSPTAYMALRRAITLLVASRSGLSGVGKHAWAAVPPGVLPMNQLWWAVPNLMRRNDTRLLNGWSWEQVLTAGAAASSGRSPEPGGRCISRDLRTRYLVVFQAPRASLDPPSLPIGGDTDTVQANGISAAGGFGATYGAIARYVYDVGNWDACRWAVFHGTSGHPGSAHYADQNPIWSRCEMVPMLYSWALIEAEAKVVQILNP